MSDDSDLVSTELVVHRPQSAGLFHTDDPVEVVEKATRVADSLAKVIRQKRLFASIRGKEHVMVEGWQLLGGMLGVSAVCMATERVDGGWKATVEARATDGRVVGRADALCTKFEKSGPWKNADDYALLSMAQTRATAKALKGPLGFIVSLAGYATTPADEVPNEDHAPSRQQSVSDADEGPSIQDWIDFFNSDPPLSEFNEFCSRNADLLPQESVKDMQRRMASHAKAAGWVWSNAENCYVRGRP